MQHPAWIAFLAEQERSLKQLAGLISMYPEFRSHFAYGLLGSAVATCDTFGLDVEAWLVELRRTQDKPAVLVPPKGRVS